MDEKFDLQKFKEYVKHLEQDSDLAIDTCDPQTPNNIGYWEGNRTAFQIILMLIDAPEFKGKNGYPGVYGEHMDELPKFEVES